MTNYPTENLTEQAIEKIQEENSELLLEKIVNSKTFSSILDSIPAASIVKNFIQEAFDVRIGRLHNNVHEFVRCCDETDKAVLEEIKKRIIYYDDAEEFLCILWDTLVTCESKKKARLIGLAFCRIDDQFTATDFLRFAKAIDSVFFSELKLLLKFQSSDHVIYAYNDVVPTVSLIELHSKGFLAPAGWNGGSFGDNSAPHGDGYCLSERGLLVKNILDQQNL